MYVGHVLIAVPFPSATAAVHNFPERRNNDSKDPITGEIISEDDLVDVKTCKSASPLHVCPPNLHALAHLRSAFRTMNIHKTS